MSKSTNQQPNNFTNRKIKHLKVQTKILLFHKLYNQTTFTFKLCFSLFLGLIMSFVSVLLAESTGLYVGGFNYFFQWISRFVRTLILVTAHNEALALVIYNILFWGLYLVLNTFLFIFSYRKIGKQFTILTAGYLIVLQIMGFIWAYCCPAIENFDIFGQTASLDPQLKEYGIKMVIFLDHNEMVEIFRLFIYAIVFALINAIVASLLFIIGSSTAGSDIISIYWSQKKNKSVGGVLMLILTICMFLGIFLGSYGSALLIDSHTYYHFQYLCSGNLFCSFLWIILFTTLLNRFFPWKKYTRVEIYASDDIKIRQKLRQVNYPHPTTIIAATGGYSGQSKQIIITVCMLIEVPQLIKLIRQVDQTCLISTQYTDDLDGAISIQEQTS